MTHSLITATAACDRQALRTMLICRRNEAILDAKSASMGPRGRQGAQAMANATQRALDAIDADTMPLASDTGASVALCSAVCTLLDLPRHERTRIICDWSN